jgi:hypothetical protein
MATLTAARAAATFPVTAFAGAGVLQVAYGSYTLAANPTAADIIQFCKVPAGATVIGGWLRGEDIDTGTEELDIDIGWAANGGTGVGATADPDGFGNFGVITGDAVTELKPEVSIFLPLNGTLKSGPVSFDAETMIQGVVNVDAQAGGTGVLWLTVFYVVG